ncbi:MAG: GNAT family N-acetyltransferase [candidate division Zixibacteria bacterium]|nr:GNAT family N-acetyltransferase [candidate division Zixibacteria bacterium]
MAVNSAGKSDQKIVYRLMESSDLENVLSLMNQSQFTVSGLVSKAIYRGLCHDALSNKRVVIGVAAEEKTIAAFLIVIVDVYAYWRSFAIRHPFLGFRLLCHRSQRGRLSVDKWAKLSKEDKDLITGIVAASLSKRSWTDSNSHIAKVSHIYTHNSFRGRGIGSALYDYAKAVLWEKGARRLDAKIDPTNVNSVYLHINAGFRIERDGNSLFATRDLD